MSRPKFKYCSREGKPIIFDELGAMMALARRQNRDKGEIRYYKCPAHNHYHLTSQEKRS